MSKKLKVSNSRKTQTSHNAEKNENPLVSPGIVCDAEKEEKPFCFSSLGQMIQFGTIKFCRTFEKLFWSVRVD